LLDLWWEDKWFIGIHQNSQKLAIKIRFDFIYKLDYPNYIIMVNN
jgi:hypothetical protein